MNWANYNRPIVQFLLLKIAILIPNLPIFFNLLFQLVGVTSPPSTDANHYSASGTSKIIAKMISEELNYDSDNYTYGKKGMGLRKEKSIAFSSIRSGGFPGSVKVIFGFENEKMELTAHVYNMNTYAEGMIVEGLFLKGKSPGLYDLKEAFNL